MKFTISCRTYLALSLFQVPMLAFAQDISHEHPEEVGEEAVIDTQINAPSIENQEEMSLFERLSEHIASVERKSNKFNLYLNMHGDFAAEW